MVQNPSSLVSNVEILSDELNKINAVRDLWHQSMANLKFRYSSMIIEIVS